MTINLGADKTPDWAGATPPLCTVPCPKQFVGSLQPNCAVTAQSVLSAQHFAAGGHGDEQRR
jgi:hypothetical protein